MDWDTVELLNDKEAEIEDLKEQNTRLQAQLNKEIQINRKMKSALEKYADEDNWSNSCVKHLADSEYNEIEYEDSEYQIEFTGRYGYDYDEEDGYSLAQQVLKEIDNKE